MSEEDMTKRTIQVPLGDGAVMAFPRQGNAKDYGFNNDLRYGQGGKEDIFAAASCLSSYEYLVLECTQKEALRRIKLIRAALGK